MSWTRPQALLPGDTIGLCAPAGPVEAERLERGAAELRSLGFEVLVPDRILERSRFSAGNVERRLAELSGLFEDPGVAAIVCARGGAGAVHLLPRLDPELLLAHPKPLVGFSDITALHLLLNHLGLISLHGPMAAVDLATGSYDRTSFVHALTGAGAPYQSEADDLLPLRPGAGEGRLRGGCLSLLATAAGTPWALRSEGEPTLLFLEDADEPAYRIDRMLRQLGASGALDGVRGIVLGDMKGCAPGRDADYTLEQVVLEALGGLDVPVAIGLSSGHASGPQVTLPLGVRARLVCDAEQARFEVLEPAVA